MNFLGIDVAKAKLDCCLLLKDNRRKSKVVPNSEEGFKQLIAWCKKQGVLLDDLHVVMESTSCYHEPVAYALFQAGMCVSLLNPARVREFAKSQGILSKNDGLDAFAIARFGASSELELWQPPPEEVSYLKALLARLETIEQDLQREYNRREKTDFINAPDAVLDSFMEHIAYLELAHEKLSKEIERHIEQHPDLKKDRALLQSIPGVGPKVSTVMMVSLRQSQFTCAEQSAAYLGLVPIQRQSGSSVRGRSRLSKNGPAKVRAKLYMAAIVAKTHNPHIRDLAQRMAQRGKCNMSIIGAAMRKLVHLCFGVLKNQLPYQPNYSSNGLTW